jgi:hypothetical protein
MQVKKMNKTDKEQCRHTYAAGYSFRMPQPFFRSLLCDNCGRQIKLSLPWRLVFWLAEIGGLIIAAEAAKSVHIEVLGSIFYVQLIAFILVVWAIQLIARFILKYGKWIEAKKE